MHCGRSVLCLVTLLAIASCAEPDPHLGAVSVALTDAPPGSIFELPPKTTARLTTLIPASKLPASENAAFIEDGRFFVAGADGLYEIIGGPESFSAELFVPNPGCLFGGLTAKGNRLYAPCTRVDTLMCDLLVFEPARDEPLVARAPIATRGIAHFNGSAFGPDGALYLSNSVAVDSPDPSVVRLEILGEEPLVLEQTAVVAATRTGAVPNRGGGTFPNGVRFHDDMLYLVRGVDLVRTPIDVDFPVAELEVVYEADGLFPVIDDFDIGDGRMWLSEFGSLGALALPNESQLVVTDLEGKREYELPLPFLPSSTVVAIDTMFGPASILITSWFNGGLYRVTFDKTQ